MALGNLKGLSELANVAKGKTGKQVLSVPVEDVVSKAQVRKRFRNIEELAATLVTEGQQSPIIVSPKGEDGKYVIQKESDVGGPANMQTFQRSTSLSMIRTKANWMRPLGS